MEIALEIVLWTLGLALVAVSVWADNLRRDLRAANDTIGNLIRERSADSVYVVDLSTVTPGEGFRAYPGAMGGYGLSGLGARNMTPKERIRAEVATLRMHRQMKELVEAMGERAKEGEGAEVGAPTDEAAS